MLFSEDDGWLPPAAVPEKAAASPTPLVRVAAITAVPVVVVVNVVLPVTFVVVVRLGGGSALAPSATPSPFAPPATVEDAIVPLLPLRRWPPALRTTARGRAREGTIGGIAIAPLRRPLGPAAGAVALLAVFEDPFVPAKGAADDAEDGARPPPPPPPLAAPSPAPNAVFSDESSTVIRSIASSLWLRYVEAEVKTPSPRAAAVAEALRSDSTVVMDCCAGDPTKVTPIGVGGITLTPPPTTWPPGARTLNSAEESAAVVGKGAVAAPALLRLRRDASGAVVGFVCVGDATVLNVSVVAVACAVPIVWSCTACDWWLSPAANGSVPPEESVAPNAAPPAASRRPSAAASIAMGASAKGATLLRVLPPPMVAVSASCPTVLAKGGAAATNSCGGGIGVLPLPAALVPLLPNSMPTLETDRTVACKATKLSASVVV